MYLEIDVVDYLDSVCRASNLQNGYADGYQP
jgi:hypothetical protein